MSGLWFVLSSKSSRAVPDKSPVSPTILVKADSGLLAIGSAHMSHVVNPTGSAIQSLDPSPFPGAWAVTLLIFAIIASVLSIVHEVRNRRFDRDIRRAFKEAKRLGLLEKHK
jgi:hypothetical protein